MKKMYLIMFLLMVFVVLIIGCSKGKSADGSDRSGVPTLGNGNAETVGRVVDSSVQSIEEPIDDVDNDLETLQKDTDFEI
jgi:hypothetical protein